MMKFFRKHRKAVSPVIAVMLLVAVAVAAVGAYFIWFRSFQTQTQKSVQETSEGALGGQLKVISVNDTGATGDSYILVLKNTQTSGSLYIPYAASPTRYAFAKDGVGYANDDILVNGVSPTAAVPVAAGNTITVTLVDNAIATGTTHTFTVTLNSLGTWLGQDAVEVVTYTDS